MFADKSPLEAQDESAQTGGGMYNPAAPSAQGLPSATGGQNPTPTYPQPLPPGYPEAPTHVAPAQNQSYTFPPVQQEVPSPIVTSGCPEQQQVKVQAMIRYFSGMPQPQAPDGYVYVYHEQVSPLAILLCILLFPWGILFLLCMKERYWLLTPVVRQQYY